MRVILLFYGVISMFKTLADERKEEEEDFRVIIINIL